MQDKELYQTILCLDTPWQVADVDLDLKDGEIRVSVVHPRGVKFDCPECGCSLACFDHGEERRWRHLDSCQFKTILIAKIPRVKCPEHGVKTVSVPWAEGSSRFTLLFERFAIDVLQATQTVKGAMGILNLKWDATWSIVERAVKRGKARKTNSPLPRIGIDEKAFLKGQSYVSMIYDLDNSTVEAISDGNDTDAAIACFSQLSKEQNESYAFAIEKSSGRTSLQYLERLGVDASVDKRVEAELKQGNFAGALICICSGFMVAGEPLCDLILHEGFSVKRVFWKDMDRRLLVCVDFEFRGFDASHNDRYLLTEGRLICDPGNEWAVVESSWIYESLSDKSKGRQISKREFQSKVGNVPFATKVSFSYESLDSVNGDYRSETFWVNEIKRTDVPKEEFYLSYYGLPEPNFGKSWLGTWGWWMIGGIVCIAVGTFVAKRRRQT